MNRRAFVTLLGGAAAWPLVVRAQQAMPVVGFLHGRSAEDAMPQMLAYRRGLAEAGYVEGHSVVIEYRWARGQYDRLPAMATELVELPAAVIAIGTEPAALAAKRATSSIPIVFSIGSDPVELGLVASYNRPGGNATGVSMFTATLEAKRLGLLHEMVPRAATMGVLLNPKFALFETQRRDVQAAANAVGLQLRFLTASSEEDIDAAFDTIGRERIPALLQAADPFFDTRREKLVTLAAHQSVPTMYHFREFPAANGLMSYGIDILEVYRQIGIYTGRILNGENPPTCLWFSRLSSSS
jgi:putative ABC transport system substrate-binding protein